MMTAYKKKIISLALMSISIGKTAAANDTGNWHTLLHIPLIAPIADLSGLEPLQSLALGPDQRHRYLDNGGLEHLDWPTASNDHIQFAVQEAFLYLAAAVDRSFDSVLLSVLSTQGNLLPQKHIYAVTEKLMTPWGTEKGVFNKLPQNFRERWSTKTIRERAKQSVLMPSGTRGRGIEEPIAKMIIQPLHEGKEGRLGYNVWSTVIDNTDFGEAGYATSQRYGSVLGSPTQSTAIAFLPGPDLSYVHIGGLFQLDNGGNTEIVSVQRYSIPNPNTLMNSAVWGSESIFERYLRSATKDMTRTLPDSATFYAIHHASIGGGDKNLVSGQSSLYLATHDQRDQHGIVRFWESTVDNTGKWTDENPDESNARLFLTTIQQQVNNRMNKAITPVIERGTGRYLQNEKEK